MSTDKKTNPFQTIAALKSHFPEDVARISEDEERLKTLLKRQAYAEHEGTKELIKLARRDILNARLRLASERSLTEAERTALWLIIEARQWVLSITAADFSSEIETLSQELEAELSVSTY